MIYLQSFTLPSAEEEEDFLYASGKTDATCYPSVYPFTIFGRRGFPRLDFDDVTIFCADNGSGKSTILNVIADRLRLRRNAPYNRTDFFDDYVGLCRYTAVAAVPENSGIIQSDDVFEHILDIRRLNDGIDARRQTLIREYTEEKADAEKGKRNPFSGMDDFERWKAAKEKRTKTQSEFLRRNLVQDVGERSNGETALAYFTETIGERALYLLDEPENSLSPKNQLLLKYYLEDCVRCHGCQVILSTHSPFLLSLEHARIYDFDAAPPVPKRWTELSPVRTYFDFFREKAWEFST